MLKKANGEGTIYFDKSRNKYKAMLMDVNGKRISKRFSTKAEAVEWMAVTQADIFKKNYIPENNMLLGEWIIEYINVYKKSNIRISTLRRYLNTAANIEEIAHITLQDLTAATIQRFYNNLPPISSSSKLKIHKLLKAAIKKAVQLGLMKDVMLAVEPMCQAETKEIKIFTKDELHKILSFLKTSVYYNRYYIFVKLAITTGARLGELLALQPQNVHENYIKIASSAYSDYGKMILNAPKTNAGYRNITISSQLAEELLKVGLGHSFIFHTSKESMWDTHNVERAWRNILKQAGVEHKHFHALRHTHATQLLAAGVPLLEVSKRLGHSKTSHTLDLYGHAIPGYDTKIPQIVQNIFEIE